MKKILTWILIFVISVILFRSLEENLYKNYKPIFKSLKIYQKQNTNDYYLVYEIDKSINQSEITGTRMYLHGRPVNSEAYLLPDNRKKNGFDNWDFKLKVIDEKYIVKKLKSEATTYKSIAMGVYLDPEGAKIKNRSSVSLSSVELERAAKIEKFDLLDLPETQLHYMAKDLKGLTNYNKMYFSYGSVLMLLLSFVILISRVFEFIKSEVKPIYRSKKDIFSALSLFIVSIYPIFIFLKSGAISTVADVLLGILIVRFILKDRIKDRSNILIYIFLILTMAWWYYATVSGIAPNDGRQWYKGIMIKYMLLPILLSLTKVDWNKIKKISWIYLLASVPYWKFFIVNFNKARFGDAWGTQHMAQIACGLSLLSLMYIIFGKINFKLKVLYGLLLLMTSIMVIKSGVRGVWIAYPPLVVLILFLKCWKKTFIAVIIVVAGLLYYMKANPDNYYVKRIASIEKLEGGNRLEMWKSAPEIIKSTPFKGIGIKGFKTYINEDEKLVEKEKTLREELKNEREMGNPDQNIIKNIEKKIGVRERIKYESVHIHNTYLEVLISTGIVGFILYFTTFSLMLKRIWNKFRESKHVNEKIFLMGILLFNGMQMIYGLTEYTLPIEVVQQSVWFFMALALNYEVRKDEG